MNGELKNQIRNSFQTVKLHIHTDVFDLIVRTYSGKIIQTVAWK